MNRGQHNLLEIFRRRFYSAEKALKAMPDSSPFSLKIELIADVGGQSKLDTPPSHDVVRFIMTMRPLLDPRSDTHLDRMMEFLIDNFSEMLSDEIQTALRESLNRKEQSAIAIQHNGEILASSYIYDCLCEGVLYDEKKEHVEFLNSIDKNTPIPHFLWMIFYDYCMSGYDCAQMILNAVSVVRKSSEYKELERALAPSNNQCIYCLSTKGTFKSVEHVIPESLGNDTILLPKGFVCDKCNNGMLARLDEYLANSIPFSILRVLGVQVGKDGKLPKATLRHGAICRTGPRRIEVQDQVRKPLFTTTTDDGTVGFNLEAKSPQKHDPVMLGRALAKMGLGLVAYDQGHEYALSGRYDDIRTYIRSNSHFDNYYTITTHAKHSVKSTITCSVLDKGTIIVFNYHGFECAMNIEQQPLLTIPSPLRAPNVQFIRMSKTESE